ncbi:MAG: hypothetical protein HC930_16520, partial [Hydrococcus sp. SU_1_0]|nr:hypothetical protein [Hydrococcus sp. SU_1_0]
RNYQLRRYISTKAEQRYSPEILETLTTEFNFQLENYITQYYELLIKDEADFNPPCNTIQSSSLSEKIPEKNECKKVPIIQSGQAKDPPPPPKDISIENENKMEGEKSQENGEFTTEKMTNPLANTSDEQINQGNPFKLGDSTELEAKSTEEISYNDRQGNINPSSADAGDAPLQGACKAHQAGDLSQLEPQNFLDKPVDEQIEILETISNLDFLS